MIFAGLLSIFFGACVVWAQGGYQNSEKVLKMPGHVDNTASCKCMSTLDGSIFKGVKIFCSSKLPVITPTTPARITAAPAKPKPALSCPNPSSYILEPKYTITARPHMSTSQSTTYLEDSVNYGPQSAIDNNINTITVTGGYSVDPTPWWRIDMHGQYIITGFAIRNRAVHQPYRLHDFEVRVGNADPVSTPRNLGGNPLCYFHPDGGVASAAVFSRHCTKPLQGRYLSIQIMKLCNGCAEPNNNYLVMSEVYIYGCKI